MSESPRQPVETSLGPPLEPQGALWVLDLHRLPILHGLSVLSRALAEMVAAQARGDRIDISVERRLRPAENPELIDTFGIDLVKVGAEREALAGPIDSTKVFERQLRGLLGSLQRERYRRALLPDDEQTPSRALLAEFDDGPSPLARRRLLLEFVRSSRSARRGFLRITIEDPRGRRLDLESIPYVRLQHLADRSFIAGSTRIASSWGDAARREAERGRRSLVEKRRAHVHLFEQLEQAGLGAIEEVAISWTEDLVPWLLEGDREALHGVLKRVLLALEDRHVREVCARREIVRIDCEDTSAYLDLSRLGRTLNLSIGEQRRRADLAHFLERMPTLGRTVEAEPAGALADTSVFLVHHLTSEVLGLIEALRRLGCRDVVVVFVVYAGEAPASYLDALFDLPEDELVVLGLANVPTADAVEGRYLLSAQLSPLEAAEEFERALAGRDRDFLESMRAIAATAFLRQAEGAAQAGRRLLVVEDGGYLAPILAESSGLGETAGEFFGRFGLAPGGADRALADWLADVCLGTVEHTRNGYDRLLAAESEHGRLALPAFSIAVSHLKLGSESREVAASVLNALESVLHADGAILSRRRALVLGSRGAIGAALFRSLEHRLLDPDTGLHGVDRAAEPSRREAPALAGLAAEDWVDKDLVVGATGESVLSAEDLEAWWLGGRGRTLYLVSASTKQVEFGDAIAWIDRLLGSPEPALAGRPVRIAAEAVDDPRTGRLHGHRYTLREAGDGPVRENALFFLAGGTPANFLFYGVPTEVMDEVLSELLTTALGLRRRALAADPLPRRVLAVDREIDARGEPLDDDPLPEE